MTAVRPSRRRVLAALAATVLLAAGCTGAPDDDAPADVVDQGYQSGDGTATVWQAADRKGPLELSGTDYAGAAQDVADWRGDVVVLNTWYAACPPCRAEAPDLVQLAQDYADEGVHVLGINGTDAAGAAEAFQRQFEVPYPSLEDTDGSAVAALQGVVPVNAVPTTVLLDKDGKVAARILGLAEGSTLRALVDDLLAEQPGGAAS
ncbi:TlpA family protein disulfide reductase [Cellulomonas fimi]|uniref:Redoxin domain protein n=1 Tax=Cellulomonas fimi (strain ATCC 484 / DSM 20113 / JCM 1341 / CCUG 24087 / LMG 16345 / NBRC 15513 / NCIMB 8980 / NCTC 7547 / NRS-133) TaxID=590998 RepID=F4H0S7_CELFA|nr:TlpA disulfide reductase family protein [Cellulomonas fimi]AEE45050.1 Redoxin domain protein [Cellulomonas fimi ATCC 484]NNH07974.1 TlpA family protein disulfide reductase [Cellulomonas fimi]VEH28089.1 Thiol-disulfide oxidoreductase resA [Cellulomonas fimi]